MNAHKLTATVALVLLVLAHVAHADDPLDTWTWRNPLPTESQLVRVACGNGKYVAFGYHDATVLASLDGVNWMPGQLSMPFGVLDVTYGNGQFVAVGSSDVGLTLISLNGTDSYVDSSGLVLTSADGTNWVERLSGVPTLEGIAFGDGQFVVVGDPSTNGSTTILTSPDGVTWTQRQSGTTNYVGVITYGNGQFVAAGAPATLISSDGVNWTTADETGMGSWPVRSIAYGNGIFVGSIYNYGDNPLVTSSDGVHWETQSFFGPSSGVVALAYGNGQFVAVGGAGTILTSADGTNWLGPETPSGMTNDLYTVGYGNGQFLATGRFGTILTSADGTIWIQRQPQGAQTDLYGCAFGNGQFVAVGRLGSALTSADGVNWIEHLSVTTNSLSGIAYNNNAFVAVGSAGMILTSPNGANWTQVPSETTNLLKAVVCGKGQFVAVGEEGAIVTSADGTNWAQAASGLTNRLTGIAYGDGQFVAIGDDMAMITSTDGTNWVGGEGGPFSGNLRGIAYGNGEFVAIGDHLSDGVVPLVLTSPDGINWTSQWEGWMPLNAIAYGGGQFAVAIGELIFTTADGVDWNERDVAASADLSGFCYGNGHFVAVGLRGAILESGWTITLALTPGADPSLLKVSVTGPTGLPYTVQSSTDLVSWASITNFTSVQSTTVVLDALTPASEHRFYRTYSQ